MQTDNALILTQLFEVTYRCFGHGLSQIMVFLKFSIIKTSGHVIRIMVKYDSVRTARRS